MEVFLHPLDNALVAVEYIESRGLSSVESKIESLYETIGIPLRNLASLVALIALFLCTTEFLSVIELPCFL